MVEAIVDLSAEGAGAPLRLSIGIRRSTNVDFSGPDGPAG